ncbi:MULTISPECIES: LysR family transcriptional regulator [unclassified Variovorax]|uniref:LysR family transcriptional regulator n=1 Tax=unclassified Variovorax TaxID=663243 RepID=UPI002578CE6A|nr:MULTISPECIES: LysR family transcriptional regulator [unclassified Variovorax]MDM0086992.1 LysR family transcriptional regulator [Variovorax sp. J22G40]MDM0144751.1 LysR family transcriptional regulator [Variovorax sp. J2P1-31]
MNHLRFLRYVDEIARAGSIRQAAERLHVAPSAVNRRLQDIEEELGAAIFERLPRGMRLTAAGELFIRYVRTRSAQLEQVQSQIEELKGQRRGTVRLVVSQALTTRFLPQAVAGFRKTRPQVGFEVHVGDHVGALTRLRAYESDVALVFNLAPEPDIERVMVMEQRLMVLMHKDHPLASRAGLRLRDCADYPLALPNRDTGGRQLLERFLLKSSVKLSPVIESNSFEFLRNCLHDGQTLSFQIAIGAASDDADIVAKDIEERGFPRGQLVLARLVGRQLPVIAHSFAAHLEKALGEGVQG